MTSFHVCLCVKILSIVYVIIYDVYIILDVLILSGGSKRGLHGGSSDQALFEEIPGTTVAYAGKKQTATVLPYRDPPGA